MYTQWHKWNTCNNYAGANGDILIASSITAAPAAFECDVGKLLHNGINIQTLSRDQKKYKILTHDPNPNPASCPCTHICSSDCFRQFQPVWVKSILGFTTVNKLMVFSAEVVLSLHLKKLVDKCQDGLWWREFSNWVNIPKKWISILRNIFIWILWWRWNEGNFIEFVCFRAECDDVLKTHAPKNAAYTSKTI